MNNVDVVADIQSALMKLDVNPFYKTLVDIIAGYAAPKIYLINTYIVDLTNDKQSGYFKSENNQVIYQSLPLVSNYFKNVFYCGPNTSLVVSENKCYVQGKCPRTVLDRLWSTNIKIIDLESGKMDQCESIKTQNYSENLKLLKYTLIRDSTPIMVKKDNVNRLLPYYFNGVWESAPAQWRQVSESNDPLTTYSPVVHLGFLYSINNNGLFCDSSGPIDSLNMYNECQMLDELAGYRLIISAPFGMLWFWLPVARNNICDFMTQPASVHDGGTIYKISCKVNDDGSHELSAKSMKYVSTPPYPTNIPVTDLKHREYIQRGYCSNNHLHYFRIMKPHNCIYHYKIPLHVFEDDEKNTTKIIWTLVAIYPYDLVINL